MKRFISLMVIAFGFVIHSPCFAANFDGKEEFVFETRELSREEVVELGYDKETPEEIGVTEEGCTESDLISGFCSGPFGAASPVAGAALVNGLAGVVQKLLTPSDSDAKGTLIGQAIPKDVKPFDLAGGKVDDKVYEKKLKSSLLRMSVVSVQYKISFRYAMNYKGKGNYLSNVKFTPLKVSTDPLWSLDASAVSEEPVNIGTEKNPIAQLNFSITFKAKGTGTRSVTDEFEAYAKSGSLKATVREFDE